MARTRTSPEDVEDANRRARAPEDPDQRRREEAVRAATLPASGAPVQHAFAGSVLSSEKRPGEGSETAESLKRAAENDGRV